MQKQNIMKMVCSIVFLIDVTITQALAQRIERVYEQSGNIFIQYVGGKSKQLTSAGKDKDLQIANNKSFIVFLRKHKNTRESKGLTETQIILIDLKTGKEKVIVQGCKHYGEKANIDYANSNTYPFSYLCDLRLPLISSDSERVYFMSEAWAVCPAIHYYSLRTGKISFFSSGWLNEIESDGNIKVTLTGIEDKRGRYTQDWLFNKDGKKIKPIGEKEF